MYRITIDVGGTFTDCLVMDGAGIAAPVQVVHHAHATPRRASWTR